MPPELHSSQRQMMTTTTVGTIHDRMIQMRAMRVAEEALVEDERGGEGQRASGRRRCRPPRPRCVRAPAQKRGVGEHALVVVEADELAPVCR